MAIISFTTTFDLTASPSKLFKFTDISNYAGQSIALSSVNGSFIITAPSGTVIYNNSSYTNGGCDIHNNSSRNGQQVIPLPLISGAVEEGKYTIVYTVYDSVAMQYYIITNIYIFNYNSPLVCIQQTVDCLSPLFTSKDITNYAINGVNPVISSYTNSIYYPNGTAGQGNPTIGTSLVVTSSQFWPGATTSEISTTATYTFSDGLIVIDIITGSKTIQVDCRDICSLTCCINALIKRMEDAQLVNEEEYLNLKLDFSTVMSFVGKIMLDIRCGNPKNISCYIDEIKRLTNCTDDCKCSDTNLTQISGLAGLVNQVVVNSGGSPVIVTPVTVGNTTTYTISLSSAFVNFVNSIYETVVEGQNFVSVQDLGITAGIRTFILGGAQTDIISSDSSINVAQVYQTSGTLTIGKKYQIITYTGTDDFTNVGAATNASGVIFVATGTTPAVWTNLSTLNLIGLQFLDITKNLHAARNETDYHTPFAVSDGTNTIVTGASLTISVNGVYQITYEADLVNTTGGAIQALVYRIVKNGTTAINLDRVAECSIYAIADVGTPFFTQKIVSTALATLVATDVVELSVDTTVTNFTITGRSISIIKVG